MDKWPFDLWLNYAVQGLKLSPSEFWSLPICDWLTLTAQSKPQGMSRDKLNEMTQNFPDRSEND